MKIFFKAFSILFSMSLFACVPVVESLFYDPQILPERFYNKNFEDGYTPIDSNQTYLGLIADTHQNYEDLQDAVGHINALHVDGVIQLGDFTNLGTVSEYRYFLDIFKRFKQPAYAILGNHDATGIGHDLYQQTMGPRNYDIVSNPVHFIFLDNNTLETGGIDWGWLENVLSKTTNSMKIVFMHINPNNSDYFSAADQTRFLNLMNTHRVGLMVHGHNHVYLHGQLSGIHYLQVNRTERALYSTMRVQRTVTGEYDVQIYDCKERICNPSDFFHFVE